MIAEIENKWLAPLYILCRMKFNKKLVSHDHTHHYRVWLFAKIIIEALEKTAYSFTRDEIESIFIATFFHDIGMSQSTAPDHGKISREMCNQYFNQNTHPADLPGILEAIELHDDKDYIYGNQKNKVLQVLSMADDLDAFGAIGVYRYAEIYLLRNIQLNDLHEHIINNAQKRFANLKHIFRDNNDFIKIQEERQKYLLNFYSDYGKCIDNHSLEGRTPCQIISYFKSSVINKEVSLEQIPHNAIKKAPKDNYFVNYFYRFKNELEASFK
jgi:HD superfamily phosphodiesterase